MRARRVVAAMVFAQGEHHHAAEMLDAAIRAVRALGDPEVLATAILARGNVSLSRREFDRATECAEEGARLSHELGNPYGARLALAAASEPPLHGRQGDTEDPHDLRPGFVPVQRGEHPHPQILRVRVHRGSIAR